MTGDLAGAFRALSRDSGDWDMVKLFTFRPEARQMKPRRVGPGMEIGVPYKVPSTTLGYGLRRAAAERLLTRAKPFFRPIDEDLKFYWEQDLKIALLSPATHFRRATGHRRWDNRRQPPLIEQERQAIRA